MLESGSDSHGTHVVGIKIVWRSRQRRTGLEKGRRCFWVRWLEGVAGRVGRSDRKHN